MQYEFNVTPAMLENLGTGSLEGALLKAGIRLCPGDVLVLRFLQTSTHRRREAGGPEAIEGVGPWDPLTGAAREMAQRLGVGDHACPCERCVKVRADFFNKAEWMRPR